MRPARRPLYGAIAASALVHGLAVLALALHAPALHRPDQGLAPPPPAVIPVLILPKAPPPPGASGPPAPIRLHRRPQRGLPEDLPIAPLITPAAEPEAPPERRAPAPLRPAGEDPVAANARQALRGVLGCDNANLLELTPEEREKCRDRFARGGRPTEFPGLALDPDKASEFGRAAARKEADYNYMRAPPTPSRAAGAGGPGQSAEDMGRALGNDRPALKQRF